MPGMGFFIQTGFQKVGSVWVSMRKSLNGQVSMLVLDLNDNGFAA